MGTPIFDGLRKYADDNIIRFHMPGHKGKDLDISWDDYIPKIDVTEIEGTDNLHNPTSVILESQQEAARVFGAKETLYSINGTTAGIYAAITSVAKPGDRILVQRDCHRSVYNAMILGRIYSTYIYPKYSEKYNLTLGVTAEGVEEAIKQDNSIKALVVTYPTYYGVCCDIAKIADIAHKYNKILIVDEAHGSHLIFNDELPLSALKAGADIVIQSTHKTLPAFTQSSMVHIGSDRVNIEQVRTMLSIFQTTSPSYILMASLDRAREFMEGKGKEKLQRLIKEIQRWTDFIKRIDGVSIFDKDSINESGVCDFDITKLLISIKNIRGKALEEVLRKEYNIQLEMSDYFYGLALLSVFNEEVELESLAYAIKDIASKVKKENDSSNNIAFKYIKPEIKLTLHEAFYSGSKIEALCDCVNKISGGFIIPYPPGIPLLCPGEVITSEIIDYIGFLKENNIQFLGFLDYNKEKIKILV